MTRTLTALTLAIALVSAAATAQEEDEESTNQVGTNTAWSVFSDTDPTECWAVSAPSEIRNTRDGRIVAATRGDILLLAFYRPSVGVAGQIAFTGGYPFASGSTVNVNIDGTEFELFTEGEWAWAASPSEDAKIVTAMKRGAQAILTGRSSRGTTTVDTFSLLGFTASIEDAERRCTS